jgi:voltage-gated sodium channel
VYERRRQENDASVSSVAPQVNWAGRVVASPIFTRIIVTTILVNAVVLGLHTYDSIDERWGTALYVINGTCLAIFTIELCIRIAAYWPRPLAFFRDGWNVFDFIVIGAAFVPGIRESSTLLRLARLARVVRIVRLLPELRVLLAGVWRSVPPLASIGAVTMTLFVMLTLEDFPTYMDAAMEVEPWAWIYFVSFNLVAAFIVLNVLIGIVLNSMD